MDATTARARAAHYRRIVRETDADAREVLLVLAEEYEELAEGLTAGDQMAAPRWWSATGC